MRTVLFAIAITFTPGALETCEATDPEALTLAAAKAAFVQNFAKFVGWPADILAADQALSVCVIGDNAVADALERTARTQAGESRPMIVQIVRPGAALRSCHLLYVTGLDPRRAGELFAILKGASVFTVGDGDRFAENGGVVRLILEGNRMRFAINVASAQRARLSVSSRLLSLAQLVKDDGDVQY